MKRVPLLLLVFVSFGNGCGSPSTKSIESNKSQKIESMISQKSAFDELSELPCIIGVDQKMKKKVLSVEFLPTKAIENIGALQITDADLVLLKGMTSIQSLNLYTANISDSGLAHLKSLASMQTLVLNSTNVSDAGLSYLKGVTKLETLYLNNTRVTDAGIKHLKGLTSLKILKLVNTKVTDAGVKELRVALLKCLISR